MKLLSPEVQSRLRSFIEPATQHYLQMYTNSNSLTLEIGCGPGQYRLAVNGNYVAVDITVADYKGGVPRTPDVVADAKQLPFRDNTFDLVFFSNVFHYFDDRCGTMAQVIRVLRPGGYLLIFDYSRKTLRRLSSVYAQSSPGLTACVRSASDWVALLARAGFSNVSLSLKSFSLKHQLLKWGLPHWVYFFFLDMRDNAVVLVGQKPD